MTIRVVVETMVEEITGVKLALTRSAPKLISTIRRTGGFNSDWDTSYALTLFATIALEGKKDATGAIEALTSIVAEFGSAPRGRGQEAVDSFLDEKFPSSEKTLGRTRRYLGYPETPPNGRMTTIFDELYFGDSLFRKMHGVPPSNPRFRGLIELERALVTVKTLETLTRKLGEGRLAVLTGRPFLGTDYSLGRRIMSFFDKKASMFIGDADINPSLRPEYDKFRKPNPDALIRAKEKLSSDTILYVGDSADEPPDGQER